MRTFTCSCGNQLFFDNSVCVRCKHEVGWCPTCRAVTDVVADANSALACSQCSTALVKCVNYAVHNVCNRFVAAAASDGSPALAPAAPLCDCCRFNRTIPDLSVPGNKEKWARLEAAKRRTLYDLDMVGFPYGSEQDGIKPGLAFEFKADVVPDKVYRGVSGGQKVYTGHADGVITINIQEADDVEREKLRVDMQEAHRTLVGHFRHEFGHYEWEVLIKGRREEDFNRVFGDYRQPDYGQALAAFYKNGAKPNWPLNYVSAYATMHPWEDFAETFGFYLDMATALDTAANGQLIPATDLADIEAMIRGFQELGVKLNELNRNIGFLDYLPEVIAEPIKAKLRFIHSLTRPTQQQAAA